MKLIAMFKVWLVIAAIAVMPLAASTQARAAGVFAECDASDAAGPYMGMFTLVNTCSGTLQDRLYNATAAVNNYNAQATRAQLGMLQLESGCGTNRSNVTSASSCGVYDVKASNSSAYGATQILSGTWQNMVTNSSTMSWVKQQLGGCGATPAAGGLASSKTTDAVVRAQFEAFRAAACGIKSTACDPARQTAVSCKPVTNQQHWGSMVGVSVLMAKAHDLPMASYYTNSNVNAALANANVDAFSVIQYAGHNLGSGGGPRFLDGLAANPSQPVSNLLSQCAFHCNPGLYCATGGQSSSTISCGSYQCKRCTSPLSASAAAGRMNNPFVKSSCVNSGLAALDGQLTGPLPAMGLAGDGHVPSAADTIMVISGDDIFSDVGGSAGDYQKEADKYRCSTQSSPAIESPEALAICHAEP